MSKSLPFLTTLANLSVREKWLAVIAHGRKAVQEAQQQKADATLEVLTELTHASNFYSNKVACMLLRGYAAQALQSQHLSIKQLREEKRKNRKNTVYEQVSAVLPPSCLACAAALQRHPSEKISRLVPFYLRQPQAATEEEAADTVKEEELTSLLNPSATARKADTLQTIFRRKEQLLERFQEQSVEEVLRLLATAKDTAAPTLSSDDLLYLSDTALFFMTKLLDPCSQMTSPSNTQALRLFKESFPLVLPLLRQHEKESWYHKAIIVPFIKKHPNDTLWFLVHQAEAQPEELTLQKFDLDDHELSGRCQRRFQRDGDLMKRLLQLNYFGEFTIKDGKPPGRDIALLLPHMHRDDVRRFVYQQHIKNNELRIENLEAEKEKVTKDRFGPLRSFSYFLSDEYIACIPDEKDRRTEIERKVKDSPSGSGLEAVLRWCSNLPFPEYRERLQPSPQYGNVNLLHAKEVQSRSHALCMAVGTLKLYPEHADAVFVFLMERMKNDQNPLKNDVWEAICQLPRATLPRFYATASDLAMDQLQKAIAWMIDNLYNSRDTCEQSYKLVIRFLVNHLLLVNEPFALSLLQHLAQKTDALRFDDLKPLRWRKHDCALSRATFKTLYTHVLHPGLLRLLHKSSVINSVFQAELEAMGVFYLEVVKDVAAEYLQPLLYDPKYAECVELRCLALEYNLRLYPEKTLPYVRDVLVRKEPDVVTVQAVSDLLARDGREAVLLPFLRLRKAELDRLQLGSYYRGARGRCSYRFGNRVLTENGVFFTGSSQYMQHWSAALQEAYIHLVCDKMRPSVNEEEDDESAPLRNNVFAKRELFILLQALPCCTIDADPLLAASAAEPKAGEEAATDALVRELTIEMMAHMSDEATLAQLLKLLEHKETAKRALTSLKMRLRHLTTAKPGEKQSAAAHEARVKELVRLVQPALASKQVSVQKDVIAFIGQQGGDTALQTLLTFLRDKNTPQKEEAAAAGADSAPKAPATIHKDVFAVLLSTLEFYLNKEEVWQLFDTLVEQFFTGVLNAAADRDGPTAGAPAPYVEVHHLVSILSYSRRTFYSFKAAGATERITQHHYQLVLRVMKQCMEAEEVVSEELNRLGKAGATDDKAQLQITVLQRQLSSIYQLESSILQRLHNETDVESAFLTPEVMDVLTWHVRKGEVDNSEYTKGQRASNCLASLRVLLRHVFEHTGLITRDQLFALITHDGMYKELFTQVVETVMSHYAQTQGKTSEVKRNRPRRQRVVNRKLADNDAEDYKGFRVLTRFLSQCTRAAEQVASDAENEEEAQEDTEENDLFIYHFFTFLLDHPQCLAWLKERSALTEMLFYAPPGRWLEGLERLYHHPTTVATAAAATGDARSVLVTAALLHPGTYAAAFSQLTGTSVGRLLDREDRREQLQQAEEELRAKADAFEGTDVNRFYFHLFLKRLALQCYVRAQAKKNRRKDFRTVMEKNYKEGGNALLNGHPWLSEFVSSQL